MGRLFNFTHLTVIHCNSKIGFVFQYGQVNGFTFDKFIKHNIGESFGRNARYRC